MKKILFAALTILSSHAVCSASAPGGYFEPTATYKYAERDTCELFFDVYEPVEGSCTSIDGMDKPTILYVFGGGFMEGRRDDAVLQAWARRLTADGFRVISIDYRLGLKGVTKLGIAQAGLLEKAMNMAAEDLFSATRFIIDNGTELGIDPYNIVISGGSAGAMTVMQAEWLLCNGADASKVLPEGFDYAGVISFAGAVFSRQWGVKYQREPAPTMLLHGTADKLVPYNKIAFLNISLSGTNALAKAFSKGNYNRVVLRYKDHGHEIAIINDNAYDEEMEFIRTNVMKKERRIVDKIVEDPSIGFPSWGSHKPSNLYNKERNGSK